MCMVIGPEVETSVPYKLQSTSLMPVMEVGDLGFTTNANLNFSSYYKRLAKKTSYSI